MSYTYVASSRPKKKLVTDGRTDEPSERPSDGRAATPSYGVAWSRLKMNYTETIQIKKRENRNSIQFTPAPTALPTTKTLL